MISKTSILLLGFACATVGASYMDSGPFKFDDSCEPLEPPRKPEVSECYEAQPKAFLPKALEEYRALGYDWGEFVHDDEADKAPEGLDEVFTYPMVPFIGMSLLASKKF
ncbi:uncharacterized protein CELE_C37H5.10 [Caenorhabditis elegans]|uniref:Secreted protein n=1 Tax=Caenorhabditis elegans TaxID=6239 RepID=P91138_CAEEL|nr:Secreted protein [Caenorhabditis elegans]CCD66991.1 Secreted protein [Caenorhabditis elegans]|eukprot:NP_504294.1 Coexpressed With Polycystins [Caenorhabditis elegans]